MRCSSNAVKGHKGFVSIPVEKRFWSRVKKSDGCWLWTGGNRRGYGSIYYKGRNYKATHISWFLHYGEMPKFICHKCDNPPCVRPDHLFKGNNKINGRDMVRKGRHVVNRLYGESNGTHIHPERIARGIRIACVKLNEEKVVIIRKLHKQGMNYMQIGRIFGVNGATISGACRRETWRYVE